MWIIEVIMNVLSHLRFIVVYYVLGGKSIIHDMLYKKYNHVELKNRAEFVAVVTGGSRGIGFEVVKMLMVSQMHVIIACKEAANCNEIIRQIRESGVTTGSAVVMELELKSLKSVRQFANAFNAEYQYLNLLVCNAGVMFVPYELTEDNLESHFAINYLSHFFLTELLLPKMEKAGKLFSLNPRIVNVTSCVHELAPELNFANINMTNHYITHAAYAQSKLCQLISTKILDRKLREDGSRIQVIAVHPGVVNTELFNGTLVKLIAPWVLRYFCKTPAEGATSVVYCCVDENLENAGGSYFSNGHRIRCSENVLNFRTQEELYHYSEQLITRFLAKSV